MKMVHSSTKGDDEVLSADSNLSKDGDSFGVNSIKGMVLKKGPWTTSEDAILVDYVKKHGEGNWNSVQKHSGLSRCGKSCRLRWANHLRPNLKKGAFTSEEERLIIELHAKMGNKWARMAAHLPGRTDNEIKNYWNTRIKRRHRAGLPLYPPELSLEINPENQHLCSPGIYVGDKEYHTILQSSYETPDIMFDSSSIQPYQQEFPNISASGSLVKGFGCSQFYSFVSQTVGLQKHAQGVDEHMPNEGRGACNEATTFENPQNYCYKNKALQSFNLGFPYDPDQTKKLLPSENQDSHFMSNNIFSASMPFQCAEKLELPSFQYQNTGASVWDPEPELLDSLVQSPLSGPPPPHCHSPRSSGLLEALLYEPKALKNSDNTFLAMATSPSLWNIANGSASKTFSTEFKSHLAPISQSGNSLGSGSDGFSHSSTIGSSLDENIPVHHVKSEVIEESWILDGERKETSDQFNFFRPDAILGSCWFQQSASCSKPLVTVTLNSDTLAYYEDLGSESNLSARTSASDSSWGLNSCSWNNMPPVCQMYEFP